MVRVVRSEDEAEKALDAGERCVAVLKQYVADAEREVFEVVVDGAARYVAVHEWDDYWYLILLDRRSGQATLRAREYLFADVAKAIAEDVVRMIENGALKGVFFVDVYVYSKGVLEYVGAIIEETIKKETLKK